MSDFVGEWRQSSLNITEQLVIEELRAIQLEDDISSGELAERLEKAQALAEEFIEACGFDLNDSDRLGSDFGNTVTNALRFAFLRIGVAEVMGAMLD